MSGIFLLSHMSTGSTWLMEMLAPFFKDGTAGKLATKYKNPIHPRVVEQINLSRILKVHSWYQYDIPTEYTVVSVVRNPLDRFTSLCHRLKRTQNASYNDVFASCFPGFQDSQFARMVPGCSTKMYRINESNYIWTTYEWLLENSKRELRIMLDFLGIEYANKEINYALMNGNKQTKKSKNFRRGIVGDWKNFIPKKDVSKLMPLYDRYMEILEGEI